VLHMTREDEDRLRPDARAPVRVERMIWEDGGRLLMGVRSALGPQLRWGLTDDLAQVSNMPWVANQRWQPETKAQGRTYWVDDTIQHEPSMIQGASIEIPACFRPCYLFFFAMASVPWSLYRMQLTSPAFTLAYYMHYKSVYTMDMHRIYS